MKNNYGLCQLSLSVLWPFLATWGCGSSHANQRTKAPAVALPVVCEGVTNGDTTTAYEAVALLEGKSKTDGAFSCTGTFVHDDVMITAAHCLDSDQTSGAVPTNALSVVVGDRHVAALQAFFPQISGDKSLIAKDYAVLTFPPHTAPATVALATRRPAVGDALGLVGFGTTTISADPKDDDQSNATLAKFAGSNTIALLQPGEILFYGESGTKNMAPRGSRSISGYGDSGGPLFVGGRLVGSVSGGDVLRAGDVEAVFGKEQLRLQQEALAQIQAGHELAYDLDPDLTTPDNIAYFHSLATSGVTVNMAAGFSATCLQ